MSERTRAAVALQEVLAQEHAAVYLYGVLGGRTSSSEQPTLATALDDAYDGHVAARDTLIDRVVAAGAHPVGAAAAYALPSGIESASGVRAAALAIERRCAAAYLDRVSEVSGEDREVLVTGLGDAALRELAFGGRPQAFPGTA